MARTTPATLALEAAGVVFEVHTYAYDREAPKIGLAAAQALGVDPDQVLKTLMILADGKPACAVIPSDREVSMKKLAAALGAKSAEMMKPAEAERLTGYKVGGISPLGARRAVPIVIEEEAQLHDRVFVNGGGRGLQIFLATADLARAAGASFAAIIT